MEVIERTRCPAARTARHGACEAPGCSHYAGTRQRICRCCLWRVGLNRAAIYSLAHRYMPDARYRALEDAALAELRALGPRPLRKAVAR